MARIKIPLPDTFDYSTTIPVRITDVNYGGHLGNDAMLSILHEARMQFLNHLGYSEGDIEGSGIIMADSAVVYKSEAFYGDVLRIEVAAVEFQNMGCDIVYRVTNDARGSEVARAKTGIVFFDYSARKPVRMPDAFRKRFV
jgi:acyl-CoA thioester hydrolase